MYSTMDSTIDIGQTMQSYAWSLFHSLGVGLAITIPLSLFVISCSMTYNAFLHPLASYPGPKLWGASRLPWCYHSLRGYVGFKVSRLHQKYGPVVRIGPDELSYTTDTAWRTIYGRRQVEMQKPLDGHGMLPTVNKSSSIFISDHENHQRIRKSLAYAFSDRALRDHEGYIQHYVDLLMTRLRQRADGQSLDMVSWFNWITFDVVGDLTFGDSLGCLDKAAYHPWVDSVNIYFKSMVWGQVSQYYNIRWILNYFTPKGVANARARTVGFATAQVDKRLARKGEERKDFVDYMTRHDGVKDLTRPEMHVTSSALVVAGSETTASLLSGMLYWLLMTPHAHDRLKKEIRTAFSSEDDIKLTGVDRLKYLTAVLNEALRLYPATPANFPRVVPPGGEIIDGKWVPGGMVVGINHLATYRSESNFSRPQEFHPERWLDNSEWATPEEFANDNKEVHQPFSFGPRNCIGKNLAWAEMRLITARLIFNFDISAMSDLQDWADQRLFMVWEKKPLMVKLAPVDRSD